LAVVALAALVAPAGARPAAAQETPTPVPVTIKTRAQFLHAAPNLGAVDISFNYDKVISEFKYGQVSEWVDIPPGATEVSMNANRRGMNYLVFDTVYPISAGNDFYSVLTDQILLNGPFDTSPVPNAGARVQIVHASLGLPAVNVVAKGASVDFASQLSFPRTSNYSVVPAGTYDFEVKVASSGQTALSVPNVTLNGNTVYELVVMGAANDADHPLALKILEDATFERTGGSSETTVTPTP
jgi:hypothetical protein